MILHLGNGIVIFWPKEKKDLVKQHMIGVDPLLN